MRNILPILLLGFWVGNAHGEDLEDFGYEDTVAEYDSDEELLTNPNHAILFKGGIYVGEDWHVWLNDAEFTNQNPKGEIEGRPIEILSVDKNKLELSVEQKTVNLYPGQAHAFTKPKDVVGTQTARRLLAKAD